MFVKNLSQLTPKSLDKITLELRKVGLEVLEIAIKSVEPSKLIQNNVKVIDGKLNIQEDKFDLNKFSNIFIIGGGKASAQMTLALEKILKRKTKIRYEGFINIPEGQKIRDYSPSSKIRMNPASHPIPNEKGLTGTKEMVKIVENATKSDLIICVISGGGSALLPLPKQGITLEDLQKVNSLLLASGASIYEINIIRKHLSDFKGGNLAKKVHNTSKATLITLIISDVVGNNLDSIASGPTVPDLTTFDQAYDVLKKYNLSYKVPSSVKETIEKGLSDPRLENPKEHDVCFTNIYTYLIGSVDLVVEEVSANLKDFNFIIDYFTNEIVGEAVDFGKELHELISIKLKPYTKKPGKHKLALIGTGELTVTIKGKGVGGRNQEMLLSFLDNVKNKEIDYNFLIIGANLDGIEGNSKAMGALVDNISLNQINNERIKTKSYLENNDSNSFFKLLKSEIITGPTGINVNDLLLILIELHI
ncbi:MAG: glycerate kinase [Promethearchaeota archaeon Loki_b31]|nr:MAG: glycerate kinase [Candidatus Lokiarchaeota archaeon Loki_b31]